MNNSSPSPRNNNKKNAKSSNQAMQNINTQNKQKQQNQPSQKKNFKKYNQPARSNDVRASFYRALTDPFDPNSMGCQVPDPFPFPTQTFHVHQTTVIGNNNSNGFGTVAFLPNPVLSMIDVTKNNTLGTSTVVQNTPFTAFATGSGPNSAIYGAVSPTALSSVFSDYRVVSWGIKISNLQPELSATGRLMVAMIPIGDTVPSYNELTSMTNNAGLTSIFGMTPFVMATSNILELPTGFEVTVGDLLHGDLEIAGMYSNAEFWTFKTSVLSGTNVTGQIAGDSVSVISSTGTINQVGFKDMTRCKGGAAIVIYFEGMPQANTNCFQVETIYHLEGTPNFSTTANNALISSVARKECIGTTNVVEQVMAKASKVENAVSWIEKGANFLNQNKSTIFKIGSAAAAFL